MARFSIKDKETGVAKYSGSPVYNGTYLKPSFLSFQRVSSAALIPWKVGDYIDYPRTGLRYYLYTLPPVKKQARSGESGEAFTYDDVRLYSREKDLEICPFRDLVPQDNEIHFSTQPSISTYENVYGIGRRFQECLNDLYPGEWEVRVVTSNAPEDAEFIEMISEPRDFTVSGVSILGGLDKVYEVWPLCGWIYSFENGKNVLTIGGANIQAAKAAATSWSYGKGNGITDIRQNFANDGEIVNRLYVYGANRNIPLNYYNRLQIKDAESVDIEHLMLPLSRWGLTDGLPDARKAYIENATSVAKYGVRPKTVYFDGSDSENPAIFPSIQKATIGDIRAAMGYVTTTPYYPSSRYSDSERADKIVSAVNPSDDGDASTNGKQYESGTIAVSISGQSVEVSTGQDAGAILLGYYTPSYLAGSKVYIKPSITGQFNLISGTVAPAAILYVCKQAAVGGAMQGIVDSKVVPVNKASNSQFTFTINENILATYESASGIYLYLYVYTEGIPIDTPIIDPSEASAEYTLSVSGSASVEVSKSLAKRFTVRLKQIGFDINERAALGDGKTISFKTGMCAGRNFEIESATYDSTNDQWVLSVWRCVDTSFNEYFPNSSYQIAADDEFVLLDIAMPDIYIGIGANRLLAYGEDLLDYLSSPQINLDPGIDAKYVHNESRTLKEGMYILVTDSDIIESATPSMVDTITINEGASNIPTYKVTLRERKRKTWTETVDSALNENTQSVRDYVSSSQSIADYYTKAEIDKLMFFEVDTSVSEQTPAVKLKEKYSGLYTVGFLIAGGIGSGGGGGGGMDIDRMWQSLQNNPADQGYENALIATAHIPDVSSIYGYIKAITSGMVTAALGYTPFNAASFTKANIQAALGISDWALASSKPGYSVSEISGLQTALNGKQDVINDLAVIRNNAANGNSAYNSLTTVSAILQSLQSQIDSVASRDCYDELTSTVFSADVAAISTLYAEVISLNGADLTTTLGTFVPKTTTVNGHALSGNITISKADVGLGSVENTALSTWAGTGNITTLGTITTGVWHGTPIANDYLANKTIGVGNAIITLGGSATLTQIGIPAWAQKAGLAFSDMPAMYIARTRVISGAANDTLLGVTAISNAASSDSNDETRIEWDATNHAWHFYGGIYANTFVVAGGVGSGGGGGSDIDLDRVWESLTNNTDFPDVKINLAHIPNIPWANILNTPTTLAGYGITDAKFGTDGADYVPITLGATTKNVLTAHQSLAGYATESWVGQQGFITKAVNDLTNYYLKSETYTQAEVNALIGAINQFRYEIAASTSAVTDPQSNVLYLIGPTGSGSDKYEEYVYANNTWTKIGDTSIDLTPYLTITAAAQTYQPIISDLATIRNNATHGETAYSDLATVSELLQSLQSQIDSVASRDCFDELTASVFYSDIAAVSDLYVGTVSLNGVDLAGSLSSLASRATSLESRATALEGRATSLESRATTLESYFTNGVANSALRLSGTATYSIWGVEYWSSGVPKSVTGRPGLYIGTTQVQTSAASQDLNGIAAINASGLATIAGGIKLTTTKKIYFGDTDHYLELDSNGFHFSHGVYSEDFITAGGIGSGGSGGGGIVDTIHRYADLGGTFSDSDNDVFNAYTVNKINTDLSARISQLEGGSATSITTTGSGNVVTGVSKAGTVITVTKGTTLGSLATLSSITTSYVTDLESWIAGKGYVTSSGVTSVGLSVPTGLSVSGSPVMGSGTLAITFASGYSIPTTTQQSAWSGKQDAISDLTTIRNNAANGATAYGWGNHASAGYLTSANGTTISAALQSLQSQVDSVATKNMFDELAATVLNADMLTAINAYIETVYGSLSGNATTASYLVSASYGVGGGLNPVYFSGGRPVASTSMAGSASVPVYLNGGTLTAITPSSLFSGLSSSAATNLSVTIAGQGRTIADLYARYDKDGGEIAPNMTVIGTALRSLQSQVDSVASRNAFDELTATVLFSDMLSVGGDAMVGGLATVAGGIKLTTTKKIWFNDTVYIELDSNGRLHTNAGFYSDSFITAGA